MTINFAKNPQDIIILTPENSFLTKLGVVFLRFLVFLRIILIFKKDGKNKISHKSHCAWPIPLWRQLMPHWRHIPIDIWLALNRKLSQMFPAIYSSQSMTVRVVTSKMQMLTIIIDILRFLGPLKVNDDDVTALYRG